MVTRDELKKLAGCDLTADHGVNPPGLVDNGFVQTEVIRGFGDAVGVLSAVLLSFTLGTDLTPSESPHDLFRIRVEAEIPDRSDGAAADCDTCDIEFAGQWFESGQPVENVIDWQGWAVYPAFESLKVDVCARAFRRGDGNSDAAIDVSDAIFLFAHLFGGGPEPSCREAANANSDLSLDISDGIYVLNYLFNGGPAPGAPGPETCGTGGAGSLSCERYSGC